MNFVVLVPLAWLPLFLIVMALGEAIGDYLVTMIAWFVLGLVADVILYNLAMPVSPDATVQFAVCQLLILLLAPFVGCYVRYKREQRQEDLKRAEQKRQKKANLLPKLEDELSGGGQAELFRQLRESYGESPFRALARKDELLAYIRNNADLPEDIVARIDAELYGR